MNEAKRGPEVTEAGTETAETHPTAMAAVVRENPPPGMSRRSKLRTICEIGGGVAVGALLVGGGVEIGKHMKSPEQQQMDGKVLAQQIKEGVNNALKEQKDALDRQESALKQQQRDLEAKRKALETTRAQIQARVEKEKTPDAVELIKKIDTALIKVDTKISSWRQAFGQYYNWKSITDGGYHYSELNEMGGLVESKAFGNKLYSDALKATEQAIEELNSQLVKVHVTPDIPQGERDKAEALLTAIGELKSQKNGLGTVDKRYFSGNDGYREAKYQPHFSLTGTNHVQTLEHYGAVAKSAKEAKEIK